MKTSVWFQQNRIVGTSLKLADRKERFIQHVNTLVCAMFRTSSVHTHAHSQGIPPREETTSQSGAWYGTTIGKNLVFVQARTAVASNFEHNIIVSASANSRTEKETQTTSEHAVHSVENPARCMKHAS